MGVFDFFKKKPPVDTLAEARQRISAELREAEKDFLQHKIDLVTFDNISSKRNSDLIRVEAAMDLRRHKGLDKSDLALAEGVSSDKKKVMLGLLEGKRKKVYELKVAEASYLKRRISEETYKKIVADINQEMVAIEGQIRAISESEAVSRLKEVLKSGAAEIAKQEKISKKRQKAEYEEELEDEIFEQTKDSSFGGAQAEISGSNGGRGGVAKPAARAPVAKNKPLPRRLRRRQ